MRILHFEFSEFFRRFVHDLSVRHGYDYIGTDTGENAFKLLAKHDVNIILTGMELSDMHAEQLIEDLKSSKYSEIPVVILTSSEIANIHKRLKGLEFSDFILKESLTPESFKRCIQRFESTD